MSCRLVTLQDGTEVPSDSEAWRRECEIRSILAMPSREHRRAHLDLIQRHRGIPARRALEKQIWDYWERQRVVSTQYQTRDNQTYLEHQRA